MTAAQPVDEPEGLGGKCPDLVVEALCHRR